MIHLLRQPATPTQFEEMLEDHEIAIKVVVDLERSVLAAGGEFHGDGSELLEADGSHPSDLWGATWYLDGEIHFTSVINIKPAIGNRGVDVRGEGIRRRMGILIRRMLEGKP